MNSWHLPTITYDHKSNLNALFFSKVRTYVRALSNTWAKVNDWTVGNDDSIRKLAHGYYTQTEVSACTYGIDACICACGWVLPPSLPPSLLPSLPPGCLCLVWSDERSFSRVRLDWKRSWSLLDSHTWHCWTEMSPLIELSYQAILPTWTRVLLANCQHEAELHLVTLCLQVGPCVSAQARLVDCCSSRDCGVDCSTSCVLPVATIITSVKRVEHCA